MRGRILIVGVCHNEDRLFPRRALVKELRLQFVLGYVPEDFTLALDLLRSPHTDAAALVSRVVGFTELPEIFEGLRRPNPYNKVLVDPSRA